MTGKCNLLKPVDCKTGTFFMFSQYAQDLTREYTQADAYRCVPSKFAALKLDVQNYTDKQLGQIFQNYFENACTCMRSDDNWSPEASLPLVWETLEEYGLITINESDNSTCDNLKYIGDINIYSYNPTKDGVGYSEIYCYVPNSAKSTSYTFQKLSFPTDNPLIYNIPDDVTCISGYAADDPSTTFTGCHWLLEDQGETRVNLKYYNESGDTRYYEAEGYIPYVLADDSEIGEYMTTRDVDQFDFNAVLVFYDVVSKGEESDNIKHKNIPLGIFFTGTPDSDNPGELTNTVTKFINNEDIYNQGTSYGLRICSRFLCSPNLTVFEDAEVTTSNDNNEELTHVLSLIAENSNLFADISKEILDMNSGLTTHMASFRNNKVNVPYLRKVNNAWYWFVNGKNTGVSANAINQKDVDYILTRLEEISTGLNDTVREIVNELQQEGSLDLSPIPDERIDIIVDDFRNILNS